MSKPKRKIVAIDCETDPFLAERIPVPFIWGAYDGATFHQWEDGRDMLEFYKDQNVYLFAHNGGKFDFMFLLPFMEETRVSLINGRIVEMKFGKAILRDSFAIIPTALKDFQKTDIEYWKMEAHCRAEHMDEITSYLRDDCINLYELVSAYHEAAGTRPTIASNALAFAKKLGINPGRTSHRFDNVFREFYFGGRVEAFKPGTHRGVGIFDIKSAYPYAMSFYHPSGSEYIVHDDLGGMPEKDIQQSFIDLWCFSHGAFPLKDENGSLSFPYAYERYKVTGWEYVTALKHGLIGDVKINAVYQLESEITFKEYVDYWYDHKNLAEKKGDKAQRIVGKYMMNSLYGKLAQNPIHYFEYKLMPGGSEIDYENGWQLETEFGDHEVHSRSVLWRYKQRWGDDWQQFPIHYNVATGASITGFTRAMLMDAIYGIGREHVLYCDTDCVFATERGNLDYIAYSDRLGDWEREGTADIAHICGKKLYAARLTNGKEKIASKGSKLSFDEIEQIARGETVVWKNDAPTFSLANEPKFVLRKIRATAQLHQ